jgi:hypothetical protein
MDRAGIGGAEVVSVYPLGERGNTPLFAEDWARRVEAVVREAERLGMRIMLRAGSGRPLGGPWIQPEEGGKALARGFVEFPGPRALDLAYPEPRALKHWTVEAVEAIAAVNVQTGQTQSIPIDPSGRLRWMAPEGYWHVAVVYRMKTNQQVSRAEAGSRGLVLDHFNAAALQKQLARLEPFVARFQAAGPKAWAGITADSLELDDSNWTADTLAEFQKRRGYDLRPYLPLLWSRLGSDWEGVRHDFFKTLSELQIERYFRTLDGWAAARGLKSFVQAHGSLADVLEAYGAVSVPEGETIWPYRDRFEVNVRNRRLAASAAALYGKPVVSAEIYTWLRMPRFLTSLAAMKGASDAAWLDGINQVKNHGYSSSPPREGRPGFVFYASTMINHNQTWWPHYPSLARYVARMNYLMQAGERVADVALYYNLPDAMAMWDAPSPTMTATDGVGGDDAWHRSDLNPGFDASARISASLKEACERLQKEGIGFDIINDDSIGRGALKRYRSLALIGTHAMPAAVVEAARQSGVKVFAVGSEPEIGFGLNGDTPLRGWAEELKSLDDLVALLRKSPGPDFRGEAGWIHRRSGNADWYFVANGEDREIEAELTLRTSLRGAQAWDPMTGETRACTECRAAGASVAVRAKLGPRESRVYLFGAAAPAPAPRPAAGSRVVAEAKGPWRVEFGAPLNRTFDWTGLMDWFAVEEIRAYGGIAVYRTALDLPPDFNPALPALLDLGQVEVSAEAFINGKPAGVAFMRPYRVPATGLLRPGRNELEIRVANLWSNYVLSLPPQPSTIPAPGYGITDALYGPSQRIPQESGLRGPVRLLQ